MSELEAPCYDPFGPDGANVNLLFSNNVVDPISGSVPYRSQTCRIRKGILMDEVSKKAALRFFSYGLYAVTTRLDDDENAFTANWVTQVSFDPPLLALSVENTSHSIQLIRATGMFTVNVLASGDREVAGALGKRWGKVPSKLAQVPSHAGASGCAVLDQALAHLDCEVERSVPAGDSTVFIARIVDAGVNHEGGSPLTMAESGFRHAG